MDGEHSFGVALADRAPAVRALYGPHGQEFDNVLPYVFMGDVARTAG